MAFPERRLIRNKNKKKGMRPLHPSELRIYLSVKIFSLVMVRFRVTGELKSVDEENVACSHIRFSLPPLVANDD